MKSIWNLGRGVALFFFSLTTLAVAVLAGCASTTEINGAWVNPKTGNGSPVSNVLVIGINRDTTARRIHEDAIVAQLAARGIKARPSYELLLELGLVPPLDIKSVVRNADVDAVLVSRTVRVSTEIRVTPGHSDGPAVFYRMWSGAFSTAPNVYTVQSVEVETRLFDVKDLTLLWSGSSMTNPTSSMQQTISEFATVLIRTLADAKVIV